ncbi:MAG: acyl-CoA thioesterase [Halanaeroarchaeum sp.]
MTEFPFETTVPIRYADFDTLGHVNNAVYATILEEARIAYYEEVMDLRPTDESLVVVHLEIDFERPLEAGPATVRVGVESVGTKSFTMGYAVMASGERVATAQTVMATLDPETGRARPVPDTWRRAFGETA